MQFYSIWPYFACMAIVLMVASTPMLGTVDERPRDEGKRRSNIDGLRGFLAFGVVFHHGAVYHQYLQGGHWGPPPSSFYAALGPVSVALFFMITAYLFWGRLIDKRGRPRWTDLYIGRIFRLFPLYLFAIGILISLVFIRTGFSLNVTPGELFVELSRWSLGGMVAGRDINSYPHTSLLLAGVTWTLWFEWRFYAALLPLSLAAREGWAHLWLPVVGLVASLSYLLLVAAPDRAVDWLVFVALFCAGMVCASLERQKLMIKLPNWCGSIGILAMLFVCVTRSPETPFSIWMVLALGLAFYLIVSGADLFGLLTHRSAIVTGDMSYSVYLLHGLVFAIVFGWEPVVAFESGSPVQHWMVVFGCVISVLLISSVTHAKIERAGIAYGRQFSAAVDRVLMRGRPAAPSVIARGETAREVMAGTAFEVRPNEQA